MIKPGMFISDRYEIIDKVGSGGMADVYKARCHRLNRFVAIKVLKTEYNNDKTFVEKFRAEAQSAAGLSHPNIVNVYDVGEDEGLHYIVMELIEGITLKSFIERKGKLEVKETVGIAIQIAQGLEAAHVNHIIHRDIKPQNIIISKEGKVKVTDFGIAKAATSNTVTSNAMGSVHYISPEQARGGYSDEKSDIYSLGVTMYEMLTGKVPFAGDNTVSVALLHIQGDFIPIRELEPEIPVSIDKIVQKCMQKKPERRYLSAHDLISDLKKALSDPDGDFVKIPAVLINDSPTIRITEGEVNQIKTGSKAKPIINDDEEFEDIKPVDAGDSDDEVDPKLEKALMIGGIAAAVILALILIFLLARLFGLFKFGGSENPEMSPTPIVSVEPSLDPSATPIENEPVIVPVLVGEKYEDKKLELETLLITPIINYEYNDQYEEGIIIYQEFEAGTEVEVNSTIKLTISSGTETIPVPDVYNKTLEDAKLILDNSSILYREEYAFNDTVESGYVISTNPERASSIAKNQTITIIISKGKESVKVPNLVGLTEEQAADELVLNGLKGKASYKHSDKVDEGLVITQDYSKGSAVEKGKEIGFTVSLGPEEEPEYVYKGTVTLDSNPFVSEDEFGTITLKLIQNGEESIVYDSVMTYTDFPYRDLPIEGIAEGQGTIKMYLDGELCNGSWNVNFKKEVR